jgi:hypothetical protein
MVPASSTMTASADFEVDGRAELLAGAGATTVIVIVQ